MEYKIVRPKAFLLSGRAVATHLYKNMKLSGKKLCFVHVGDESVITKADECFKKQIIRACEKRGVEYDTKFINKSEKEIQSTLKKLSKNYDGIIPLISNLNRRGMHYEAFKKYMPIDVDLDYFNPLSLSKLFIDSSKGPCTAEAIMKVLKFYNVNLKGKHVVLVNRSLTVGKPLSLMLIDKDATVTICHTKTKNLKELLSMADIVITAIGKPLFINKKDGFELKDDSILLDIGYYRSNNRNITYGDVRIEDYEDTCKYICTQPDGVGRVTTAVLLSHLIK